MFPIAIAFLHIIDFIFPHAIYFQRILEGGQADEKEGVFEGFDWVGEKVFFRRELRFEGRVFAPVFEGREGGQGEERALYDCNRAHIRH